MPQGSTCAPAAAPTTRPACKDCKNDKIALYRGRCWRCAREHRLGNERNKKYAGHKESNIQLYEQRAAAGLCVFTGTPHGRVCGALHEPVLAACQAAMRVEREPVLPPAPVVPPETQRLRELHRQWFASRPLGRSWDEE